MARRRSLTSRRRRALVVRRCSAVGASLLFGLGGYGVYATSLEVTGSAGTSVQAGADLDVLSAESCQTAAINAAEEYSQSELDPETGFSVPQRTGFTVDGVQQACAGKYLTLAVKLDGTYEAIGTWQVDSPTHVFASEATGTTTAYSIRITSQAP